MTDFQKWLSSMLKDGKIDEIEKKEIYKKILPLFQKILDVL